MMHDTSLPKYDYSIDVMMGYFELFKTIFNIKIFADLLYLCNSNLRGRIRLKKYYSPEEKMC